MSSEDLMKRLFLLSKTILKEKGSISLEWAYALLIGSKLLIYLRGYFVASSIFDYLTLTQF